MAQTPPGRRIDATESNCPRFPLANVALVRRRLHTLFTEHKAFALVCSAACGADLVALEAAETLGLPRRVVLPFAPERFRKTSITDRPGDWGALYDHVIDAVQRLGDLIVLGYAAHERRAYEAANAIILDEAVVLSSATLTGEALK